MRIFIKVILVTFLGVISLKTSWAQQDAQFSHYMFTNMYHNPGYAGIEGVSRAMLLHRSQWLGYEGQDPGGAPTTQLFSLSHPLKLFSSPTINSGAGVSITNDRLGPWRILNLKLSYSYHMKLQNGGTIGYGIRAGFFNQGIDGSVLRASEDDDNIVNGLIASNVSRQLKPDLGFGVYYNTKKYWGSLSFSHLVPSTFEFGIPDIDSKLTQHMYVSGGYNVFLGQKIVLTPSGFLQTDFAETSFSYGIMGSYRKYKYWGGGYLRQSVANNPVGEDGKQWITDAFVLMAGMSFLPKNELRVGYAFDVVTSGTSAKNPTSHEIFVSYVLPWGPDKPKPPLKTPRYRHEN